MDEGFPNSLAAYELCFDRALRELAGADRPEWLDLRDIEDSYFNKKLPLDFARECLEKGKWVFPCGEESRGAGDSGRSDETPTMELF